MSALVDLAAGQAWKIATAALGILLLAGGGAGGALWWTAAAARDQAQADLKAERGISAELRAGVQVQNAAITRWYEAMKAAEERGKAAQALAAISGKRYDTALQHLAGARPASCTDVMPYVNKLLEDVR